MRRDSFQRLGLKRPWGRRRGCRLDHPPTTWALLGSESRRRSPAPMRSSGAPRPPARQRRERRRGCADPVPVACGDGLPRLPEARGWAPWVVRRCRPPAGGRTLARCRPVCNARRGVRCPPGRGRSLRRRRKRRAEERSARSEAAATAISRRFVPFLPPWSPSRLPQVVHPSCLLDNVQPQWILIGVPLSSELCAAVDGPSIYAGVRWLARLSSQVALGSSARTSPSSCSTTAGRSMR